VDEVSLETLNSEIVCARLTLAKSSPMYIMAYYRPPDKAESVDGLETALADLYDMTKNNPKSCIIVAGDFNVGEIQWDTLSVNPSSNRKGLCNKIIELLGDNHLHQLQREPTRENATLDLFCTDKPGLVKSIQTIPGISDHDGIIMVDLSLKAQINKKTSRSIPLWAKANWDLLKEKASSLTSEFLIDCNSRDIYENWKLFEKYIKELMNMIPSKRTSTRYNLPWLTNEVKRKCRKKRRLYRKAKKSKAPKDWAKFKVHQENTRKALRTAHWNFINNIFQEGLETGNRNSFWSYIKAQQQDSVGVSPLRRGRQLFSDSASKARLLSEQFCSVFTVDTPSTADIKLCGPNYPDIPELEIQVGGVRKLLEGLNPSKAAGPDEIPARLLKNLAEELAPAITAIFMISMQQGALPDAWKEAWIAPVFKKGNRNDAANYRPVSLTCILCKSLEHILCTHIRKHLDHHGILTPANHGFRAKHSCESQLLITTHDILKQRDGGKQVDVAILDFSKAFDTVPHRRLLGKLRFYGITGTTLKWVEQFLIDRTQSVLCDGIRSGKEKVGSGVPQGTVLGPLLFLLHINELPSVVHPQTRCRLFADDCLLYRVINHFEDQLQLQKDLAALEQWSQSWGMSFNASKCHVMTVCRSKSPQVFIYHLCDTILKTVQQEKYLGVLLSADMSWSHHIKQITAKAQQKLGFLRRNLKGSPKECKSLAYISLVRSGLEYSSIIWDPHLKKDSDSLERVQRRAARWVTSSYDRYTSVTQLLKDLDWDNLQERRKHQRLIFLYKILHEEVAVPPETIDIVLHNRPSRGNSNTQKISRPRTNTSEFQNSFINRTIIDWNGLPNTVAQAGSVSSFKSQLLSLGQP